MGRAESLQHIWEYDLANISELDRSSNAEKIVEQYVPACIKCDFQEACDTMLRLLSAP